MSAILKTKKDRDLFAKWNRKLEKYDDCNAEDFTLETPALKTWHNFKFKSVKSSEMEDVSNYYANCRAIYQHCEFPSALHKEIWGHYSEGLSLRDIEQKINKKRTRDTIRRYINEVKKYVRSQVSDPDGWTD